jgi:hypothetical protein
MRWLGTLPGGKERPGTLTDISTVVRELRQYEIAGFGSVASGGLA